MLTTKWVNEQRLRLQRWTASPTSRHNIKESCTMHERIRTQQFNYLACALVEFLAIFGQRDNWWKRKEKKKHKNNAAARYREAIKCFSLLSSLHRSYRLLCVPFCPLFRFHIFLFFCLNWNKWMSLKETKIRSENWAVCERERESKRRREQFN